MYHCMTCHLAGRSFQMTESRLVLVYSEYIFSYILLKWGQRSIPSITCTFSLINYCIGSTTWFGAAPPSCSEISTLHLFRSKLPGHPALGEFLGELGVDGWRVGPTFGSVGFLVGYPRWMATRWVSPPNKNEQHCTMEKEGEPTKNTLDAGNGHMSKKPTFLRFLSCFWGRPKIPSRKSQTQKSNSEVYIWQIRKNTWLETLSIFMLRSLPPHYIGIAISVFWRFLIIDQPCFWCLISPSKELFVATAPVTPKASPLQSYRSLAWQ